MTTDPDQIRAEINALLAHLPDPADMTAESADGPESGPSLADLEEMARRLSEAHDVLLRALESAEKG
ncbi:hypothetical protein [Mycobacterium sp.]|uniref:hypothetical protein n=1 Tax=Mycobacterium sp. TaxID=1785 RepID=UPI003F9AF157